MGRKTETFKPGMVFELLEGDRDWEHLKKRQDFPKLLKLFINLSQQPSENENETA
jgi:hypothetical protein